jgi:hypothetical protein
MFVILNDYDDIVEFEALADKRVSLRLHLLRDINITEARYVLYHVFVLRVANTV